MTDTELSQLAGLLTLYVVGSLTETQTQQLKELANKFSRWQFLSTQPLVSSMNGYTNEIAALVRELPVDKLQQTVSLLKVAYDEGKHIIFLGNGGSAATASHLVADFQKILFTLGGKPVKAFSLTDCVPLITAWANDTHFLEIFLRQIECWAGPGDIVIAISSSGQSPNVLDAVRKAKDLGATTVGLSGFGGGNLADIVDVSINVPCGCTQRIEDIHMIIGHILFRGLRDLIAGW